MKSTMNLQKSIFLLDGHNGTFIPQQFAEDMLNENLHSYRFTSDSLVLVQMLNELAKGQDNEWYWDNWNDILTHYNEIRKMSTNELFYLTQEENGDLWLVQDEELEEWNAYWTASEIGEEKDYNLFVLVVSEIEEVNGRYFCYVEDCNGDVVWECDDEYVADLRFDGIFTTLPHEDIDFLLSYLRSIDRLGAESKLRLSNSIL